MDDRERWGTAVARLSRLLPGCADAGSDRAHLGGAVRPGLGGARTRCRIGGSAGRAGASGPPSLYLVHDLVRYWEYLEVAKQWRGGDVAHRLIEAVDAFADGFGAATVSWLTQEYNAPARSLSDTLAHRTSFVVYQR